MVEVFVCSFTSLVLVVFLLQTSKPTAATGMYKPVPRFCDYDSDCDRANREVCYPIYDGCNRGQCMCDPTTDVKGQDGRCRKALSGGEYCQPGDVCPKGMSCFGNRCSCDQGQLTDDMQYCKKRNQKLLGESCNPYQECLQIASSGYSPHYVSCSVRGVCECDEGYKSDGVSCLKWKIGEYGCVKGYQCEGGAICADRRCICPTGYRLTASKTKCAKRGALLDLPMGKVCDEIEERLYCAHGLVCHKCDGQKRNTCVRFRLDTRWARQTSTASSISNISHPFVFISVIYSIASLASR